MDVDLIFKALANPTRRQILEWLKAPEQFLSVDECGDFKRGVCAGHIERLGKRVAIDHVKSFIGTATGRSYSCRKIWTMVIFFS